MDTLVQTLHCTTDIGAERPIHRCGIPMKKKSIRYGRQGWECQRTSCNDAYRRYLQSEKTRRRRRESNARRLFVSDMYLGMAGFTLQEREELLNGKAD